MSGTESTPRPSEARKSAGANPGQAVPSDDAERRDRTRERDDARSIQGVQGEQHRGYADTPPGEMPEVPSDFRPPALDADGDPASPEDVPRAVREGSERSPAVGERDSDVDPERPEGSHGDARRAS